MVTAKFIYRKSDNRFLGGGFYDAQPPMVAGPNDPDGNPTQVPDYVNYGVAEFGDADMPDMTTDRHDATNGKRRATAQELADDETEEVTQRARRNSRQKDVLAMCALIVRRSNPVAWAAMTPAQKRVAILAAADDFRDMRVLVEKIAD